MPLIVKYWLGWLSPVAIEKDLFSWRVHWSLMIQKAIDDGYESNVFKIKKGDHDAIADIERYLQTRYNTGS